MALTKATSRKEEKVTSLTECSIAYMCFNDSQVFLEHRVK